jgi:hypothetical protein
MIRRGALVSCALLACLASTAARAQDAAVRALEPMMRTLGTWTCEVKTLGAGAHAFTATLELKKDFDGRAIVERYEELRSDAHVQPTRLLAVWSYDPRARRIMRNGADMAGNRIADSTAPMADGKFMWEHEEYRMPVVTVSDTQLSFALSTPREEKWVTIAEGVCTRY